MHYSKKYTQITEYMQNRISGHISRQNTYTQIISHISSKIKGLSILFYIVWLTAFVRVRRGNGIKKNIDKSVNI